MPEIDTTPFEIIGGEQKVKQLVDRFYELMDTMPEAFEIRKMHPDDLSESIYKLTKFLCFWFGGPKDYLEEFGHPRLRARHLPFVIADQERDQWLMCMFQAMDDVKIDKHIQMTLKNNFTQMANHMRNQ